MTKRQLNKLALESYSQNALDPKKVEKIVKTLKRKELKLYIRILKNLESQRSIIISLPKPPKEKNKKILAAIYPDKKIVYDVDPSLILGMKVTDKDMVYQMNLKNTLNNLVSYLGGQND